MKPGFRVFCVSLVLFMMVCAHREAIALDWQPWAQWGGSSSTQNLVIVPGPADFNGDGRIDVMVYKPSKRKFWIGRNIAGFGFSFCATPGSSCIGTDTEAWATLPTTCTGYQFYSGEFGGTSLPDVAVYNPCVGDMRVLVNNGGTSGGLTGPMATVDPIAGWKMIAGDFAGDSKTDVMVYYEGDGSIFVGTNVTLAFNWTQWASVEADPIGSGLPPWQFYPAELTSEGKTDIIGYRPGTPKPTLPALNTRVGRNMGTSFSFLSVLDLRTTNLTPVVGRFTGRVVADLALRQDGLVGSPDISFLKNGELTFAAEPGTLDLDPDNALWTMMAGDFVASGASSSLADFLAYYPGDGSFWIAENRGYPPEGYAWPLSVAPGETLGLYTSGTLSPTSSNVTFSRVTSDTNGLLSTETSPTAALTVSSAYQVDVGSTPWRTGPQWGQNISFTIPAGWPPGFYVATLKPYSGPDYRITFIVKPTSSTRHRTAVLANVNTWNAYNNWGGKSKYEGGAAILSFKRPNPAATLFVGSSIPPAFAGRHLAHAEVWVFAALEGLLSRGNVDVYTDLDFDVDYASGPIQAGAGAGQYDRLILSTHPEYWSTRMYDNLRAFLDAGGDVIYLGGNGVFETTEQYEPTPGVLGLRFYGGTDGLGEAHRLPWLFRVKMVSGIIRPERALLGVATWRCDSDGLVDAPYAVRQVADVPAVDRPVFDALLAGVQLDADRKIGSPGVLGTDISSGHEIDKLAMVDGTYYQLQCLFPPINEIDTTPAGVVRIAAGTNPGGGADIIFYRYPDPPGPQPGGGFVFSVGSINFGQSLIRDEKLQRLIKNVLDMN